MKNQPVSNSMRGMLPTLFALLLATCSGIVAAQTLPGRTQSAPVSGSALSVQRPAPAGNVGASAPALAAPARRPGDFYFQRGTAAARNRPNHISPGRSTATRPANPDRHAFARRPVIQASAQAAALTVTASPALAQRLPRSVRTHRIDRHTAWAARDSSGLHFGPRPAPAHALPDPARVPHTGRLRAPQVPGLNPTAPHTIRPLPRHHRRTARAGRIWYENAAPANRAKPTAEQIPLFYSQYASLYADPLDGQDREQFRQDIRSCINLAESETGSRWDAFDTTAEDADNAGQQAELFGAARECLELAGYDIY